MSYQNPLMSEITAHYYDALFREGANFNYGKWYREMKQERAAGRLGGPSVNDPAESASENNAGQTAPAAPSVTTEPTEQNLRPRTPIVEPEKVPLLSLEIVADEADKLQETRRRDAVYQYLSSVFRVVSQWECRGKANKRARRAFKAYGVSVTKDAEIYAAVIRHTTDDEAVDAKTRSKWSRALRYVARFKKFESVTRFIKRQGGINACASLFAAHNGSR